MPFIRKVRKTRLIFPRINGPNVATLRCTKNRRYESSRVTSPLSVFMWKGEDYLNTLLVDAYFFWREKKTSVFKPIPVVHTTRHYHLCSGTVILKSSHDLILFDIPFHSFEHVISFSKWKSRSLFPFSAGSKTLKIKRVLNWRTRWIINFKKASELISWVSEVFLLLCGWSWMLRCIGPKPRDLEPKVGVTSGEASKKIKD